MIHRGWHNLSLALTSQSGQVVHNILWKRVLYCALVIVLTTFLTAETITE